MKAVKFGVLAFLLTNALETISLGALPDWPDLKFTLIAGGAALLTDIASPRDGTGRFSVSATNANVADAASEQKLLTLTYPEAPLTLSGVTTG